MEISRMVIKNKRNDNDYAYLSISFWSGILVGTDRYPTRDYDGIGYYIGGGKDEDFKATAIEFYGVKTQI